MLGLCRNGCEHGIDGWEEKQARRNTQRLRIKYEMAGSNKIEDKIEWYCHAIDKKCVRR